MKNTFYFLILSSTLLTSCGAETEQEKKAAKDVLEIIKDLPNIQKEVKELDAELLARQFNGEFNAVIDGEELSLTSWVAQRSSISYSDNSVIINACADEKCDKNLEIRIVHPDLYSQTLPSKFAPSIFEEVDDSYIHITYTVRNESATQTFSGNMSLIELGDENIKLSFDGEGSSMTKQGSNNVPLKIDIELMYNFISLDQRQ